MTARIVIFSLVFSLIGLQAFSAQPTDKERVVQEALQVPFSINIHLSRNPNDMKDAKRRNIYTFYVVYPEHYKIVQEARYNILYYLDGRLDTTFQNQSLPFSFTQNLRGQLPGRHELRIDLQDLTGNKTLTTQTITIDVAG